MSIHQVNLCKSIKQVKNSDISILLSRKEEDHMFALPFNKALSNELFYVKKKILENFISNQSFTNNDRFIHLIVFDH